MRQEMEKRYREYRDLQTVLLELLRNTRNQKQIIWQVLCKTKEMLSDESEVGRITQVFCENMERGEEGLTQLWGEYIKVLAAALRFPVTITTLLTRLGSVLAKSDSETISHYLEECVNALEKEMKRYAESYASQMKVKTVCAGLVGVMTIFVFW